MPAIGPLLKTAMRLGPVAYPLVKKALEAARNNPELLRVGEDLLNRFTKARASRSKPESLRRSAAVLRAQAQRLRAAATSPEDLARAERWLRQVDKVEAGIDLMAVHTGKKQHRDAAIIEKRVDALFAEILTATVDDDEDGAPARPQLT
ncbi:hypothetical protein [Georgenia wangjunii]|uniref:hypothetical protein n=1 Tax=Georgenia wangjunii TaxID=3117730 RepID=UPI002F26A04F